VVDLQRKPAGQLPTVRRRPGREVAAERGRRAGRSAARWSGQWPGCRRGIETRYLAELLGASSADGAAGVGYLLKDRVADVNDFVDALIKVAAGGTVLDPEVINQLFRASRQADTLAALTAREHAVLALMAEGRSNNAIAGTLVISERAVEKHIGNIFSKLGLPPSETDHRRVLAVLRYLQS
jgi:DNA-binding CsgD family transcriptional regulator